MRLTGPRSYVLDKVVEQPHLYWKDLPENYKTDKEFVLKVLQQTYLPLPCKNDFERTFPQSLRFDKDVVLAFCKRPDFEQLYKTRHLYIPGSLIDDKDVLLAYCQKIPRALQEASERLTDDEDVVRAAVTRDGRELQYASWRLQGELDILQLAVSNHGHALLCCPLGPTRDFCFNNRELMKTVFSNKGGSMYREMTNETLRNDKELIVLALHNGLAFRSIPECFRTDQKFLCKIVSEMSRLFLDIPNKSLELAVAAMGAPDLTPELIATILHKVPRTTRVANRNVALAICKHCEAEQIELYLEHQFYWNDREIMKAALAKVPTLFRRVSAELQNEPELITVAIQPTTCLNVMRSVHQSVLIRNPQIAIAAVKVHSKATERQILVNLIPDALWLESLDLQVEWMRKYGVLDKFESRLRDPELALKVAEVCQHEFPRVHERLRDDLEFMKHAVQISGRVIRYASRRIQNDRMLQVIAVANHAWSISNEQRQELAEYVNTKLGLRDTFHLILCGIHSESNLGVLNIGTETSVELKRNLAVNLGVPLAGNLKLLQKCQHNIDHPPPLTREDDLSTPDRLRRRRHRDLRHRELRLRLHRRDEDFEDLFNIAW